MTPLRASPIYLILMLVSGCRAFTSPARSEELQSGKGYWLDYDASRRGAFLMVKGDGTACMLSEPSPDVAVELAQKYLGKINYEGVSAEASVELAEQVVQLGKRTSTIMFLRESLYRLAELSNAGKLNDETAALFKEAMSAAIDLAKAEVKQAEANATNAEARKLEKEAALKQLDLDDGDLEDLDP